MPNLGVTEPTKAPEPRAREGLRGHSWNRRRRSLFSQDGGGLKPQGETRLPSASNQVSASPNVVAQRSAPAAVQESAPVEVQKSAPLQS